MGFRVWVEGLRVLQTFSFLGCPGFCGSDRGSGCRVCGSGVYGLDFAYGFFLLSAPGASVSSKSLGVEFMKVQGLSVSELNLKP